MRIGPTAEPGPRAPLPRRLCREDLAVPTVLDGGEAGDVPLIDQNLGDAAAYAAVEAVNRLRLGVKGVADAGQHVCDWV